MHSLVLLAFFHAPLDSWDLRKWHTVRNQSAQWSSSSILPCSKMLPNSSSASTSQSKDVRQRQAFNTKWMHFMSCNNRLWDLCAWFGSRPKLARKECTVWLKVLGTSWASARARGHLFRCPAEKQQRQHWPLATVKNSETGQSDTNPS